MLLGFFPDQLARRPHWFPGAYDVAEVLCVFPSGSPFPRISCFLSAFEHLFLYFGFDFTSCSWFECPQPVSGPPVEEPVREISVLVFGRLLLFASVICSRR